MVAMSNGVKKAKENVTLSRAIGTFIGFYILAVVAWLVFYTSQSIALKILTWI